MSLEKYSLKMPKAVYSGTNSMENIPAILAAVGAKKVAAFTDKGIRKLGLFDLVEEQLKASGVAYDVFDEFPPEPSYQAVQGVIDQFKHKDYDFVVACGGGSVMDTAKLASVLVTDEYGVKELLDDPKGPQPFHIGACELGGEAAFQYVVYVIKLALDNKVDATVTNALSKEAINMAGHHYSGHTEIYADYGCMSLSVYCRWVSL